MNGSASASLKGSRGSDCRKSNIFYLTGIVKGQKLLNVNYAAFQGMHLKSRSYQGLARLVANALRLLLGHATWVSAARV